MSEQSEEIKKGFQIAIWLHFLVLVGGLLYVFFDWILEDEPDPHVFKMVSIAEVPVNQPQPMQPSTIQEKKIKPIEAPKPKPPEVVKPKPKITQVPTPPPKPKVTKEIKPEPVKEVKKVIKKEPLPPKKVVPKPKPVQKKMSYEDYLKQNPIKQKPVKSQPIPKPAPVVPKSTAVPKINTGDMIQELNRLAEQTPTQNVAATPVSQNELNRYFSYVNRIIEMRWRGSMTSLPRGLKAVVAFRVEADGRITFVRLQTSSGDSNFDNIALTVLRKVDRLNRPPDGRAHQLSQPFESR